MARSAILTLASEVAIDLGLTVPSTLFGAYDEGDTNDRRLLRALVKSSRWLHRYWHWPDLRAETTFTTIANGTQTATLPADFARFVPDQIRDRTNRALVTRVEQMRPLETGETVTAPCIMRRAPNLIVYRSPYAVGATVWLEYVRDVIAQATGPGALKTTFTADTDLALWEDELMHLAMVWAIRNRDGDRTSEDYNAMLARVHETMGHESTDGDLVFGAPADSAFPPSSVTILTDY